MDIKTITTSATPIIIIAVIIIHRPFGSTFKCRILSRLLVCDHCLVHLSCLPESFWENFLCSFSGWAPERACEM